MTPSYAVRLLLLSGASFFLVQLTIAALVAWLAPAAIRRAEGMRPRSAARLLLSLRLLPTLAALLAVAALCIPSYLRFEPHAGDQEEVGLACLGAAIVGMLLCAAAIYRALRGLIQSSAYVRSCKGRETSVEGETVWVVRESAGLALAGILRPRLLISEHALNDLSGEQLSVALRHERAHRASRDNLKRLLILLAPAIFRRLRTLEEAWARFAEWAADDSATDGDTDRSLALAAALVRVARLQSGPMPRLVTSLVEANEDLSLRVVRLLDGDSAAEPNRVSAIIAVSSAAFVAIAAIAMNPGASHVVYRFLERMLD